MIKTFFKSTRSLALAFLLIVLIAGAGAGQLQALSEVSAQTTRVGGWLDTIELSVVPETSVVDEIVADNLDLYFSTLRTPADFTAIDDAGLNSTEGLGLTYELTFNPTGDPQFIDDPDQKLNPFSNRKIRDAMHWVIKRDTLNTTIFDNTANPKWVSLVEGFPEYIRYQSMIQNYETSYGFSESKRAGAINTISEEMIAMGAIWDDGTKKWLYDTGTGSGLQPVEIIFLIRTDSDGMRVPIGDQIADWLEAEDVGFTVNRQYGTSQELASLWIYGNPNEGDWHLYTGAWGNSGVSLDDSDHFQFFYSPSSGYGFTQLWQSYYNEMDLAERDNEIQIMDNLAWNNYTTLSERESLFQQAFDIQFKYNFRLWLMEGIGKIPMKPGISVITGSTGYGPLWPLTLRWDGVEGSTMRVGQMGLFDWAANPIDGPGWEDTPTSDSDTFLHPTTGLPIAKRLDYAEVTVLEGLPVTNSSDWVTLYTEPSLEVPSGYNGNWNGTTQTFDQVGAGVFARSKVVYHYPAELWNITWHDGSPISTADFILPIIMDAEYRNGPGDMVGWKIITNYPDPLVIEAYYDNWFLDAETIASHYSFWPEYGSKDAGWHAIAISNLVVEAGEAAYDRDTADAQAIPWLDFFTEPSLTFLSNKLVEATNGGVNPYIPYEPALGTYINDADALDRYANLGNFYGTYGHFWVGTGPYIITAFDTTAKTATLTHNANYIDPAGKWETLTPLAPAELSNTDVLPTFEWEADPMDISDSFVLTIMEGATPVLSETLAHDDVCTDGVCSYTIVDSLPIGTYTWNVYGDSITWQTDPTPDWTFEVPSYTVEQVTEVIVPEGALDPEIDLTLDPLGSGFALETDMGETLAMQAVDIGPAGTKFTEPVTITLYWEDSAPDDGTIDGTTIDELTLYIAKDGVVITELCEFDLGCNPTLNEFSVEVDSLSEFVLGVSLPSIADYHGAAEITSDQPIVAIGRPHMGTEIMAYGGVNVGANAVYLPMLFYNTWDSYTSTFTVENTSGSTATFDITFKDALTGDTTCTMTVESLAQHEVRTYDVTSLTGCTGGTGMNSGWYGGATIESDQPVTAVAAPKVNGYDAVTYNGFTGGDTTTYLPMLFRGIWGYESAFYVQNLDPVEYAEIEIQFYDNQGVHTCTMTDPDPIQSSVTRGYWMSSLDNADCDSGPGFSPSGWAGSAVISITGGGSSAIVAIGRPHMGAEVAAYNGFTTGSPTNYLPMLFRGQWGYDSAFYIQNISALDAYIEIEFYDTDGNPTCTVADTEPLPSKATRGYWMPYLSCTSGGTFDPSGWAGSAKISTTRNVIAVGRPHLSNGQVVVYNAFAGGGTNVYVPMLFRQYGNNESALYIQNLGVSAANTTINFYDEEDGFYCSMDKVVQPGASGAIWLAGLDNTECVP